MPPDLAGLVAADTGPALLDSPLSQVVRDTGASMGLVYLMTPEQDLLRLAVVVGVSRKIDTIWGRVASGASSPIADAVRERRMVLLCGHEDTARLYPRLALVLPYDFPLAAAPITSGSTIWGALCLVWPGGHPGRIPRRAREAYRGACDRMGRLLRRAAEDGEPVLPPAEPRVLPALRTRTHSPAEALAAADLAERLPEGSLALDLDGRITFVTETAAALLGAEVPDLLGTEPWELLSWLDDPVFEDRFRSAMISRRPGSATALRPPDRWLTFELYPDGTGVSLRVTPAPTPEAADTPAAQLPAGPTPDRAIALYHLLHMSATLTEAVGTQDVIDLVVEQMLSVFGVQAVALLTTEEGRLRIIGHRGYHEDFMESVDAQPMDVDNPAVRVLKTGVPSFFANVDEFLRIYPGTVVRDRKAAWAFLPLITSGRPVGSMALAYDRPHPFSSGERSVLISIAGLVAQALDRARLYDAEHNLAISLQARLLPRALPDVPGLEVAARYMPATRGIDIGGDFYDVIRLDTTTCAVTIGDVQGHNVNAAALMGEVRTAVRATAGASPSEVLARSNRLLVDLDPGLLASCLYAQLDLERHTACVATAGHPPPVLRHPDGTTEVLPLPPGPLLGVDPDACYPTTEIALPPGAVLALYTDGLVETPGVDIDVSAADLAAHLARAGPDASMDALADSLLGHAQRSGPRNDDIALLLTHVTGRPAGPAV
ncbi:SpoIIE family protein phosphatase [Streptomyces sp. PA03-1a]|nr:SpoIIE family protein phosphatase [Streptomyces sp. PA03-1a]MDX2811642.1 SpoIIE family protein phosphatase [Streptomyces sp. PA03-5A]